MQGASLSPKPYQPDGPPIWGGGSTTVSLLRAGKFFDGWMPTGPGEPKLWAERFDTVKTKALKAGPDPAAIVGSLYATVTVPEDYVKGEDKLMAYLRSYYGPIVDRIRDG